VSILIRNILCLGRSSDYYRQVQDLQSQLSDAKQQIGHLRSLLQNPSSNHDGGSDAQSLNLPALGPRMEKGHGPPSLPKFDHVRKSLRTYSRGVFKVPPMYRQFAPTPLLTTNEVTLPPREVCDTLLAQFYSHFHRHRPFIHWPSFTLQVEKAYAAGTLQGLPQIWIGTFFGVLACGSLQSTSTAPGLNADVDGMKYIVVATRLLNTWTDNLLLEHARSTLMISIFLTEQNIRSAGWIWLGSGVRISQDIGLHLETGPWSPQEGAARKRVYWAIFAWDR
jgi:Fungal specific transcription factor domain